MARQGLPGVRECAVCEADNGSSAINFRSSGSNQRSDNPITSIIVPGEPEKVTRGSSRR
jgi:hypothetical protein